jgi:hypothetical protein
MEAKQENITASTLRDRKIVTAMFADRKSTDKAYKVRQERAYTNDEINLVMSEDTRNKYYPDEVASSDSGVETIPGSAAIGGTIGAIAGVVAAITASLVTPGLGLVLGVHPRNDEDTAYFESRWREDKGADIYRHSA